MIKQNTWYMAILRCLLTTYFDFFRSCSCYQHTQFTVILKFNKWYKNQFNTYLLHIDFSFFHNLFQFKPKSNITWHSKRIRDSVDWRKEQNRWPIKVEMFFGIRSIETNRYRINILSPKYNNIHVFHVLYLYLKKDTFLNAYFNETFNDIWLEWKVQANTTKMLWYEFNFTWKSLANQKLIHISNIWNTKFCEPKKM